MDAPTLAAIKIVKEADAAARRLLSQHQRSALVGDYRTYDGFYRDELVKRIAAAIQSSQPTE